MYLKRNHYRGCERKGVINNENISFLPRMRGMWGESDAEKRKCYFLTKSIRKLFNIRPRNFGYDCQVNLKSKPREKLYCIYKSVFVTGTNFNRMSGLYTETNNI